VLEMRARDDELARQLEAHRRFLESCREMQAKFVDVPEDELNALIDEAVDWARHNPK